MTNLQKILQLKQFQKEQRLYSYLSGGTIIAYFKNWSINYNYCKERERCGRDACFNYGINLIKERGIVYQSRNLCSSEKFFVPLSEVKEGVPIYE